VAAFLVTLAVSASSQASPEAEHATAVESFRRGTQLVEAGNMQDAIEAFRDALRHEPASVGARLDLADCYEKIGSPATAWREYVIAESYARKANDTRQQMARSSADHIRPRLFVLTLSAPDVHGVAMLMDGEPVAAEVIEGGALALSPGSHRLDIRAPGKKRMAREVSGAAGETRALQFSLEDELPPAREPPPHDTGHAQRTWGLVLGGVGLAGVALGAAMGGIAMSQKSTLENEAHDPSVGAAHFDAQRSTADSFAMVSTVAFIAGGLGLAAGTAVYVTAPSSTGAQLRVGVGRASGSPAAIIVSGEF
jgi:hypothetical protein